MEDAKQPDKEPSQKNSVAKLIIKMVSSNNSTLQEIGVISHFTAKIVAKPAF
jgi:hypothetical protein